VICDVCGRDNADTLTFCQDCGRRLRSPRVVAPTPPAGLAKVDFEAAPPAEPRLTPVPSSSSAPQSAPSSQRRSRPSVQPFSFSPAPDPPVALSTSSATSPASAPVPIGTAQIAAPGRSAGGPIAALPAPDRSVLCAFCHASNPADYRFCVTCGAVLKRSGGMPSLDRGGATAPSAGPKSAPSSVPQRSAPISAGAPRSAPGTLDGAATSATDRARGDVTPLRDATVTATATTARGDDKIIGAPVVDIASSGEAPVRYVSCARCHGSCVAGMRFCKYCGAPLDDTSPLERHGTVPGRSSAPLYPREALAYVDDSDPPETHPTERRSLELAASIAFELRREAEASAAESRPAVNAGTPFRQGAHASKPTASPQPREDGLEAFPPTAELTEPGKRSEISQLAGSPVPAIPLGSSLSRSGSRRGERRSSGRLVVIVEDGSEGRSFSLAEGQLDIGRVDGDIILEDDHYVSPRHARLRFLDGRWVLRDLDSTNHVYVRLRKPHPLKDADLLLLGLEVLQFQTVNDGERGLGHAMQHGTLLFGSPATPRRARLCQRTVEGVVRDVYHLFRDETVIGREMGDIVFTADPFLSRRHASIRRNPTTGEFSVVDLDSSNGTYAAIRGEINLSNGDFLRIGQHLFRVDLG
jgi:pSer/pThr/pTyr-binding forkhead associated (FHA) protein